MKVNKWVVIIGLCLMSQCIAIDNSKSSVTEFNDIKPVTLYRNTYTKTYIRGLKNYKVPLYDDLRYSVFTSLMGVTRIIFPEGMTVKSHKSGMEEYFEVTPSNSDLKQDDTYRYIFIRPIIPASIPASKNMEIQRDKNLLNVLSTQLHVILQNEKGEDVFMTFSLEISSKRYENETIEIINPEIEETETQVLNNQINEINRDYFESMERERLLHFGNFKLFEVNETKTYNDNTTVKLDTITYTDGYYYFNVTLSGVGLFPLKKEDIKLETNYYSKGMLWEVKEGWKTNDVDSIIIYPDSKYPPYPIQSLNYVPEEPYLKNITFRFKANKDVDFFYTKLNIKNGAIYFEKKVFLKDSSDVYYPFLNETYL